MERLDWDLRVARIIFFVLFMVLMGGASFSTALQVTVTDATQTADIQHLTQDSERNTADIRALTATVNDLTASINRFTGIGIAVGALGGIIVILQTLQITVNRKRNGA